MDAVVPAGHPLAGRSSIDLKELAGDVWVGARGQRLVRHIVTGICAAAGFSPDVQHYCPGMGRRRRAGGGRRGGRADPALGAAAAAGRPGRTARRRRARFSRLLFALVRAGTEPDPGIRAALGALGAVAAARSDGITGASAA